MPTPRRIVEDVLTAARTRRLWTSIYEPALPITPQDFDIAAMMPMMLYLARFGHRRGRGHFKNSFGKETDNGRSAPSIGDVAKGLAADQANGIEGFEDEIGHALLGDLLLSYCLENKKYAEGHREQVQRAFPSHYFASRIDLPEKAIDLRNVPETLTALLAAQAAGPALDPGVQSDFPVGVDDFSRNPLLALFGRHCAIEGEHAANLASDVFREQDATDIGIDELLAVRMGQGCGSAPKPAAKDHSIPNWTPLARRAADALRDDLTTFTIAYGRQMPRQAFAQMIEAGIALGLTNLLLSTATIVSAWQGTGEVPEPQAQQTIPLFVDASQGQNPRLRDLSEASVWDCLQRYDRFPIGMMLLRVTDDAATTDEDLEDELPPACPDPTRRIRFLGDLLKNRLGALEIDWRQLKRDCRSLADALEAQEIADDVIGILRDKARDPAQRLAEALCALMGEPQQQAKFRQALDSALLIDRPNGLAVRRQVTRMIHGKSTRLVARSVILSSAALDFLVHRHVRAAGKGYPLAPLSLQRFLAVLREQYGLYVDRAPPGQSVSAELLLENKAWLERRLRDLGLWIGVNDAESMKQLRPRHRITGEEHV
jgi:hypothetical protein